MKKLLIVFLIAVLAVTPVLAAEPTWNQDIETEEVEIPDTPKTYNPWGWWKWSGFYWIPWGWWR